MLDIDFEDKSYFFVLTTLLIIISIFSVHNITERASFILLPLVVAQSTCAEIMVISLEPMKVSNLIAIALVIFQQATLTLPVQTNWFICIITVAISAAVSQYSIWVDYQLDELSPQLLCAIFAARDLFRIVAGNFYERNITKSVMKELSLTE